MPKTHELRVGDSLRIPNGLGRADARPLYEAYNDEGEFRTQFVKPLMQRLCDLEVADTHGPDEFGKDFVFAELDPFGCIRYCGVQVKHCRILRKGSQTEDVVRAINEAFDVPVHLNAAGEQHIAILYVFSSGRISSAARKRIREHCEAKGLGGKVFVLDGDRLRQLDMYVSYHAHAEVRRALAALIPDLRFNRGLVDTLREQLSEPLSRQKKPVDTFRTSSLQAVGMAPLWDLLDMTLLSSLSQSLVTANRFLDRLLFSSGSLERERDAVVWLRSHLDKLAPMLASLCRQAETASKRVNP